MKQRSKKVEISVFLLIMLFYVIPPIFVFKAGKSLFSWNFPYASVLIALPFAFILYFFYEKNEKPFIINYLLFLPQLGIILAFSFLLKFASVYFKLGTEHSILLPFGVFEWFCCLLQFFAAAFYEEVLYRFYLPEQLLNFTKSKALGFIFEIISLLFFAFAHLYLGVFSVINAAFAHIVLRFCFKKNGCIGSLIASHFLYNVISLILL